VARVGGHPLNIVELPRREGDLGMLIACSDRLKQVLDWQPQYDDLDFIVRTALLWERKMVSKRVPLSSVA